MTKKQETETETDVPPVEMPQRNGNATWPTGEEVLQVAQELFPREISHAASEARARKAERLLEELQKGDE